MPIVIAAHLDFEPGRRDVAVAKAAPMIAASRGEDGCEAYVWSLDPENPDRAHIFERWADQTALAAHFAGTAFADLLALLQSAGLTGAASAKHRVDLIEPVHDPHGRPRPDFFTAEKDSTV